MVVQAKLGVRTASGAIRELTVLVNGGAHSPEPVPADEQGLRGARRRLHRRRDEEGAAAEGRDGGRAPRGLEGPIVADSTTDVLGIQVVSFSRELWRHASNPPGVVMRGAKSFEAR